MADGFSVSVAGLTGSSSRNLARQLAAKGALAAFFTALPPSRTRGIPANLVHRHLALGLPIYAGMRGWLPISHKRLYRFVDYEFDRWVSHRVVQAHVAFAVAGLGRCHRQVARERFGALAVCESPTTHVRYQKALVSAELEKWGAPPMDWDEKKIASMEEEYAESDLILAPSRFAYQSFVLHGIPESRLAIVPFGVDCDEFRPMPRPEGVFRILFVGALSIRKGLPYLLEATSKLPWRDGELALLGGQAPETKTLLDGYRGTIPISLVPRPPRPQLKQIYSSASVLVLPSIEDAFGLVIEEALACGTPVIATTHTGGPDVIEDGVTGFIIPPGNADALRDALTTAYENRGRLAAMGVEARRRVEQARGWGAYGDGVVAALEHALQGRAGQRRGHAS